jgi:hypothetical protein
MFFSKVISAALLVAAPALATPVTVADVEARHLAKRVEGVHLVNCGERYSTVIVCIINSHLPCHQTTPNNGSRKSGAGRGTRISLTMATVLPK